MNTLRWRLAVWYALGVVAVLAVFVAVTHLHLAHELQTEKRERSHPGEPGFILHGTYTDPEIRDIVGELARASLLYAAPVALLCLALGYWLAGRSLRPVAEVTRQLREIGARNLTRRMILPGADAEFRDIAGGINALLDRLDAAFRQLSDFSAQVAHELRTPLTLLRLQVEESAGRIDPATAEALQEELGRLSDYVDQCLLLATAEQGRLTLRPESIPLRSLLAELVDLYGLLAREAGRELILASAGDAVVVADPRYLRQMLHALLTNALRHGVGDIRVSAGREPAGVCCRIENAIGAPNPERAAGPGLGLRVVRALAARHERLEFAAAAEGARFVARLSWH